MHPISIHTATAVDLDILVPLFDRYRQFYGQPGDVPAARAFLHDRLVRGESTVLLASDGGWVLGFIQLYPSFSSVSMAPIWVLNDLFVDVAGRRRGIGARLLEAAAAHARCSGAVRLTLSTGIDNLAAQSMYRAAGWVQNERFIAFDFALTAE